MRDKLCFAQFLHPGKEHRPDVGNAKSWNKASHRRKFLKNPGRYADGKNLVEKDIMFWGEWEPESRVIESMDNPVEHGPRFIYEPYYIRPDSYVDLQNTDPFVFGDRFLYTLCQQATRNGSTQLRNLEKGSVILFGSCIELQRFVVDTVFVVDHWCDHNETNFRQVLKGKVSDTYADTTLSPCYREPVDESVKAAGCIKKRDLRLYFGATYQNPVDGMFSFVPCLPYEPNTNGFARPVIKIEGATRDNLTQVYKLTPKTDLHGIKRLWDEVVQQVLVQELMLGVFTELPRKVSNVAAISIIDQHFAFKRDLDKC